MDKKEYIKKIREELIAMKVLPADYSERYEAEKKKRDEKQPLQD